MNFLSDEQRENMKGKLKSRHPDLHEVVIEELLDFIDKNTKATCAKRQIPRATQGVIDEVFFWKNTKINNFVDNIIF